MAVETKQADVNYDRGNPSKNVLDLVEAAVKRIDDMAILRDELQVQRIAHTEAVGELRATHARELSEAEAKRLDSIRQVDREDVAKTAAANQTAITTLASQTTALADTLRTQVATTAAAAEARQQASAAELSKRLTALELAASATSGKQAVVDPQMDRLTAMVENMATMQDRRGGKSEGTSDTVKWIIAGFGLLGTLIMIATAAVTLVLFLNSRPATATVPAPAGTTLTAPR